MLSGEGEGRLPACTLGGRMSFSGVEGVEIDGLSKTVAAIGEMRGRVGLDYW